MNYPTEELCRKLWIKPGYEDSFKWGTHIGDFWFCVHLAAEVTIVFHRYFASLGSYYELFTSALYDGELYPFHRLYCNLETGECGDDDSDFPDDSLIIDKQRRDFVAEWFPIFRRNCWLMGCNVESTAHERLEWKLWLDENDKPENR